MVNKKDTFQQTKIITFFSILTIVTIVAINLISLYQVNTLHGITDDIYEHPLKVSNAALNVQKGVLKIHRDMKDVVLLTSADDLKMITQGIDTEEKNVYEYFKIIELNILGSEGLSLYSDSYKLFGEWKSIRDEVISLVKNNSFSSAVKITKGRGAQHVRKLERYATMLNAYAKSKADEFKNKADLTFKEFKINIVFLTLFIIVGFIIFTFYIRKRMNNYIKLISEKDELMIAQSRQAAMGEMVSMIAHQWRQPLAIIAMAVNNLKIDIELEEEITPEFLNKMGDNIQNQTQYLSHTIEDFRNFLKPNTKREIASACTIMANAMKMVQKSLENNDIALDIKNDCHGEILTFPNQLLQVFLNLINNAKDVFEEREITGAKIRISISEYDEFVTISICDNGGGISEEILPRLGVPYVSSKSLNGTGLGIYMSKIIVEKHLLGKISWENKDDGACFMIELPLHVKEQ